MVPNLPVSALQLIHDMICSDELTTSQMAEAAASPVPLKIAKGMPPKRSQILVMTNNRHKHRPLDAATSAICVLELRLLWTGEQCHTFYRKHWRRHIHPTATAPLIHSLLVLRLGGHCLTVQPIYWCQLLGLVASALSFYGR